MQGSKNTANHNSASVSENKIIRVFRCKTDFAVYYRAFGILLIIDNCCIDTGLRDPRYETNPVRAGPVPRD
jgi:hypothetical protein